MDVVYGHRRLACHLTTVDIFTLLFAGAKAELTDIKTSLDHWKGEKKDRVLGVPLFIDCHMKRYQKGMEDFKICSKIKTQCFPPSSHKMGIAFVLCSRQFQITWICTTALWPCYFTATKDKISISLPVVFITWLFAGEKGGATETKTRILNRKAAKINRKFGASLTWRKNIVV